jgi:hypothetical protein
MSFALDVLFNVHTTRACFCGDEIKAQLLFYLMLFNHLNSVAHCVFTPTLPISFPDTVTNHCLKLNTALQ